MCRSLRSVRPGLGSEEQRIDARRVGASRRKRTDLASGSPRRAEDPASCVAWRADYPLTASGTRDARTCCRACDMFHVKPRGRDVPHVPRETSCRHARHPGENRQGAPSGERRRSRAPPQRPPASVRWMPRCGHRRRDDGGGSEITAMPPMWRKGRAHSQGPQRGTEGSSRHGVERSGVIRVGCEIDHVAGHHSDALGNSEARAGQPEQIGTRRSRRSVSTIVQVGATHGDHEAGQTTARPEVDQLVAVASGSAVATKASRVRSHAAATIHRAHRARAGIREPRSSSSSSGIRRSDDHAAVRVVTLRPSHDGGVLRQHVVDHLAIR